MSATGEHIDSFNSNLTFISLHSLNSIAHAKLRHKFLNRIVTFLVSLQLKRPRRRLQILSLYKAHQTLYFCKFEYFHTTRGDHIILLKLKWLAILDFLKQERKSKIYPFILLRQEIIKDSRLIIFIETRRHDVIYDFIGAILH